MIPTWWAPYVREFERRADQASAGLPLRLTSWGRTKARNKAIGGARSSQHLLWTAADFAGSPAAKAELLRRWRAMGPTHFGVDEGDHVHIQLFRAGQVPDKIYGAVAT